MKLPLWRRRQDEDLDEEIRSHLRMASEERVARGEHPERAARNARREFGSVDLVKETTRDTWGWTPLERLWHDVRYACRMLRRSPGFTAVALLTLGLGLGVNTAIFSIVNAVLFRPLPVRAPSELMYVYAHSSKSGIGNLSYRDYLQLRAGDETFSASFAFASDRGRLGSDRSGDEMCGEMVTSGWLDVLGVRPILGRGFLPEDETPDATPAIVIGETLWRARFNGDPGILGKVVELRPRVGARARRGRSYTIVGVMGSAFTGMNVWERAEYWVPLFQRSHEYSATRTDVPGGHPVVVAGRLRPGVTKRQAQSMIDARSSELRQVYSTRPAEWSVIALESRRVTLPFDPGGKVVPARLAAALMAVTGMVLLIAAANLAGILLARGVRRRNEIAVRLAMGAGTGRVVRQLLTESLTLAVLGGACGVLVARGLVGLFLVALPERFGHLGGSGRAAMLHVPLDLRVLLFTALSCVAAGIIVGVSPALQAANTNLLTALSGSGATSAGAVRTRLRHLTVVPQICLSLVLLLVAGVVVRTLLQVEMTDRGYRPEHVVFTWFDRPLPEWTLDRDAKWTADRRAEVHEARRAFYRRLRLAAQSAPGVTHAALTSPNPWAGTFHSQVIARDDFARQQFRWVTRADVSHGYFDLMKIDLVGGRLFEPRDTLGATRVAVVCELLAKTLWPDKNPIGQYVAIHGPNAQTSPTWLEVIGVVREVKPIAADRGRQPLIYLPLDQLDSPLMTTLMARGEGKAVDLVRALEHVVLSADPDAEVWYSRTLAGALSEALFPQRMAAAILGLSGLVGLLLASIGIYGAVSYSVAQRLHEIGVRAALGARKVDLVALVLGEGAKVAALGSVLGIVLAFGAVRITSSTVVAIPPFDVLTFVAVPALVSSLVLLACYVPARRAARVDPMIVLRRL